MMLVTSTNFLRKDLAASMSGCSVKCISGYTPKNSWGEDLDKTKQFTFFSRNFVGSKYIQTSYWMISHQTSSSWYWLRAQTAPRCQLERPRSGRLSMIYFISTWPFCAGGGFLMVEGQLGIQANQSNWNTVQTHRYQPIDTNQAIVYIYPVKHV